VAQTVVGLGNPGPEYRDTRHNIGHRVVDALAQTMGGHFRREGPAQVAHGRWHDHTVHLVKPLTFMNESGPAVVRTMQTLGSDVADLILVYDDIDLRLGAVRVRTKGSHGGHNGVRSVLAFVGTQEVRRVKVGVGHPGTRDAVVDHVLAPFEPEEREAIDTAVATASERVLELIAAAAATSS
jgi:PTH1 family peptidyl-tRNA hydrolase